MLDFPAEALLADREREAFGPAGLASPILTASLMFAVLDPEATGLCFSAPGVARSLLILFEDDPTSIPWPPSIFIRSAMLPIDLTSGPEACRAVVGRVLSISNIRARHTARAPGRRAVALDIPKLELVFHLHSFRHETIIRLPLAPFPPRLRSLLDILLDSP